jgi:alkylation response protein AidB-like acyl-CoA dehydrogenase
MATVTQSKMRGYSFLISETNSQDVFIPEDFTWEHRQFAQSADEFVDREIMADIHALEKLDRGLLTRKLKKAGEVGLFMIEIPEAYGGLGLDLISQLVVTERIGRSGGFSVAYAVQTGIGSEPILFFGTGSRRRSTFRNSPPVNGSELTV